MEPRFVIFRMLNKKGHKYTDPFLVTGEMILSGSYKTKEEAEDKLNTFDTSKDKEVKIYTIVECYFSIPDGLEERLIKESKFIL